MKIGNLRHRITIQQLNQVSDGSGGYTETWPDVATGWADVYPLKGNERYQAQQAQANISYRVTIRYLAAVKSNMRIAYGTRILNIEAVIDVEERHREMILMCSEVVT